MVADATNFGAMPPSIAVVIGPSASDQPVNYLSISTTAAANDLVAAVAGKKIRVLLFMLVEDSGGTSETIKFQSGGSTDLTGAMKPLAGGPFQSSWAPCGHFETKNGEKLNLVKGASTIQLSGWLVYQLVDGTAD